MDAYTHPVSLARTKMRASKDPIHDEAHVTRVAAMVTNMAKDLALTQKETDALVLAAWWHDAGRTVTKKSSLILMLFLDDLVSALMLWRETIRLRMFGSVVGMATRIIFCKSTLIGSVFARLFLKKRTRLLLHLLQDADTIDPLHIDRINYFLFLVGKHAHYTLWYRLIVWYGLHIQKFKLKTKTSYQYLVQIARGFLAWLKKPEIFAWHVAHFGREWTEKTRIGVLAIYSSVLPLSSNG